MKTALYHNYEPNQFMPEQEEDEIEKFLCNVKYHFGENILLIGEIGCLGKKLRMLGTNVTILENSHYQDVCYSLINNNNCNVVKGSLDYLPFNDTYFDKVIILDYINHTNNCNRALKELKRVLKDNGEVILEDLNMKNIRVKIKLLKHRLCGDNVKYYYPEEMLDMFSKMNFNGAFKEVDKKRFIYIGKKTY